MRNKLIKILGILLIITLFVLCAIFVYDLYQGINAKKQAEEILSQLETQIQENIEQANVDNSAQINQTNANNSTYINNYEVFGKIEIPSLKIKYPVMEYNKNTLKNSICNISANAINGTGNICIAGHNTSNGTLFGKLRNIKIGDSINLTNVHGQRFEYIVYSIVRVKPEDNSLLANSTDPIVTLITCTDSAEQRIVVQGRLIEK